MKASGCKHLTYDETKYSSDCIVSGLGPDRAVWERKGPNGFQLCHFCTKLGRLNDLEACTTQFLSRCSQYEEHEHEIIFREAEL